MKIRRALESDYEAAVGLYAQFNNRIAGAAGSEGLTHWRALLNHPGTTVFVAESEGRLAGTAALHILPNMTYAGRPYALIENVITARDHQRKGVGRKVMEAAIAAAWSENVYKIMLLTGRDRKDGGVKGFYESLGFTADEKYGMTLRRVPQREQ